MKIGIVVHSQTGNTLSVAEKLQARLTAGGHTVTIEHLKGVGQANPKAPILEFESIPDVAPYEAIVFAAPVHAFSLAQGMGGVLKQIGALNGKGVACLVTQQFPFPWMGGNRALRQMAALIQAKGGMVRGSGVVNWMKKDREQQTADVVDSLAGLF